MNVTPITEINFDETGPIILDAFIEEHPNLSLSYEKVSNRPDNSDWDRGASHYRCVLINNDASFEFYYSMGSAHKNPPDLRDVLNSLKLDAQIIIYHQSAKELMNEFGYESYSKAKKIWDDCAREDRGLRELFPETYDILIHHTEEL